MMDLFQTQIINILPYDGVVNYHGKILTPDAADDYLTHFLQHTPWQHDQAIVFGKHITTARQVAWYGDDAYAYAYTYSNVTKHALPWTSELLALKTTIEQHCAIEFNSCLMNLYHNGSQGMAWHSDNEAVLGDKTTIASLSLGAARKFSFKHKTSKENISLILEHGSLLVMQDVTQTHWLHRLPPSTSVTQARVNLTFRTYVG